MMHPEKEKPDHDKIIREALRRELEIAVPPSSEKAWEEIQSALAQGRKKYASPPGRNFFWRRFAAVAALILVFAGGGLVLNHSGLLAPPGLLKGNLAQLVARDGHNDVADIALAEEMLPSSSAPQGRFTLEVAGIEDLFQGEDHYQAAVYRRGDEKLLWACHPSPSTDLGEFISGLGRQLGVEIEIFNEITAEECPGNLLEFAAGGRPGIAWLDAEGAQALLTLSGSPDLGALRETEEFRP